MMARIVRPDELDPEYRFNFEDLEDDENDEEDYDDDIALDWDDLDDEDEYEYEED